MLYFSL